MHGEDHQYDLGKSGEYGCYLSAYRHIEEYAEDIEWKKRNNDSRYCLGNNLLEL